MFPEITFVLSLILLIGMIVYRVDETRLGHDQDEIKRRLPELRVVHRLRRGVDAVIYFVGIRVFRLIRKIKRYFRKK